jgi:uncharacterized protein (DUF3084 family)
MIFAHGHRWLRADEQWLEHLVSRLKRASRLSNRHTSVDLHLRRGQLVAAGAAAILQQTRSVAGMSCCLIGWARRCASFTSRQMVHNRASGAGTEGSSLLTHSD